MQAETHTHTHIYTRVRHTPTHSDTKETEHSQPIYRKTAITFYHAGLGPDRAALSSNMCVRVYVFFSLPAHTG